MNHRRRIPTLSRVLFAGLCMAGVTSGLALAQPPEEPLRRPRMDTTAPAAAPAAAPVGGVMQQQTRPFYLQAAVVVLLSGGAIWAVCHSSRRG